MIAILVAGIIIREQPFVYRCGVLRSFNKNNELALSISCPCYGMDMGSIEYANCKKREALINLINKETSNLPKTTSS